MIEAFSINLQSKCHLKASKYFYVLLLKFYIYLRKKIEFDFNFNKGFK